MLKNLCFKSYSYVLTTYLKYLCIFKGSEMIGSRAVSLVASSLVGEQQRGFATLKDISIRLKSVKNIQKITKSMKMVAAAKYAKVHLIY